MKRDSKGHIARDPEAKAWFMKQAGYPGTAAPARSWTNIVPFKRGGADTPSDMQWQTKAAAPSQGQDRTAADGGMALFRPR